MPERCIEFFYPGAEYTHCKFDAGHTGPHKAGGYSWTTWRGNQDCEFGCAGNENCIGGGLDEDDAGCPCICHYE